MTLSFASRRSKPFGRAKASSFKEEARSDKKHASREAHATDDVVGDDDDDAKLAPSSTTRGNDPNLENADADDVIPLLRAHVAQYATRDNWRGAQVSVVTFFYFVATALAPWLLTSRFSAAADALGLSPRVRSVASVLLWAAWGILRAAAYVRSFMVVRPQHRILEEERQNGSER